MENISDSIEKVIRNLAEKQKDKGAQIYSNWERIVGKALAKHSSPSDLRNRVLFVNVENSAWMYMLRLKQASILANIRGVTNKQDIQDIKLRIGKVS